MDRHSKGVVWGKMSSEEHKEIIKAGHVQRYEDDDIGWMILINESWRDKESVPVYHWSEYYFLDYQAYWSHKLKLVSDKVKSNAIIPLGLMSDKERKEIKKEFKKDFTNVEMYWGGPEQWWRPHNAQTDGIFLNSYQPYRLK